MKILLAAAIVKCISLVNSRSNNACLKKSFPSSGHLEQRSGASAGSIDYLSGYSEYLKAITDENDEKVRFEDGRWNRPGVRRV